MEAGDYDILRRPLGFVVRLRKYTVSKPDRMTMVSATEGTGTLICRPGDAPQPFGPGLTVEMPIENVPSRGWLPVEEGAILFESEREDLCRVDRCHRRRGPERHYLLKTESGWERPDTGHSSWAEAQRQVHRSTAGRCSCVEGALTRAVKGNDDARA
jgi:hypothetical protein